MRLLLEPKNLALLDASPPGGDPLEIRRRLDSQIQRDLARALTEQISLRGRAQGKFASVRGVLLTAKGLEQATPLAVANRRAQRIVRKIGPGALILDATAGLGADAIALAKAGLDLVAAEVDPHTALFLAQNLRAAGVPSPVLIARLEDRVLKAPFLLVDPDRRSPGGARLGDPEKWSPPFSKVVEVARECRGAVIKLAPGTDVSRLEKQLAGFERLIWEWVAWNGELKETALWTGELVDDASSGTRRAVCLRANSEQIFAAKASELENDPEALGTEQARQVAWISEPASAVLRAGLVGIMASRSGARCVGPGIAFLGSTEALNLPCQSSFRVLDSAPADRKRVRALLKSHNIGPVTVKRRGHPLDAEQLARRFRGPGKKDGLLIVARLELGHHVWLVEREEQHGDKDENPRDR